MQTTNASTKCLTGNDRVRHYGKIEKNDINSAELLTGDTFKMSHALCSPYYLLPATVLLQFKFPLDPPTMYLT